MLRVCGPSNELLGYYRAVPPALSELSPKANQFHNGPGIDPVVDPLLFLAIDAALFESYCLANAVAEEVELGAADDAAAFHFDLADAW